MSIPAKDLKLAASITARELFPFPSSGLSLSMPAQKYLSFRFRIGGIFGSVTNRLIDYFSLPSLRQLLLTVAGMPAMVTFDDGESKIRQEVDALIGDPSRKHFDRVPLNQIEMAVKKLLKAGLVIDAVRILHHRNMSSDILDLLSDDNAKRQIGLGIDSFECARILYSIGADGVKMAKEYYQKAIESGELSGFLSENYKKTALSELADLLVQLDNLDGALIVLYDMKRQEADYARLADIMIKIGDILSLKNLNLEAFRTYHDAAKLAFASARTHLFALATKRQQEIKTANDSFKKEPIFTPPPDSEIELFARLASTALSGTRKGNAPGKEDFIVIAKERFSFDSERDLAKALRSSNSPISQYLDRGGFTSKERHDLAFLITGSLR